MVGSAVGHGYFASGEVRAAEVLEVGEEAIRKPRRAKRFLKNHTENDALS